MTTKGTGAGKPPPASPVECEVAAHSRLMRQWQEPDANIRHLDALISSAEGGWRRTRNPLFVWWALAFAGYCKPPRPIPEWSADYLRSSGNSMIALLVGEPKPATLGALKKVLPRALGITRDGHNAFASFRAWIEQAIEAEDFDAAIGIIGNGTFDAGRFITATFPLPEAAAAFEELTLSHGVDQLKAQVPDAWPNLFRQARFLSAVDFVQAERLRRKVAMEMERVFSQVDLLLVPSLRDEFLVITNFTGHPSLTLRAGFVEVSEARSDWAPDPKNPLPKFNPPRRAPYGVTLVGRLFEEGTLAEAGIALEQAFGVATQRPPGF